MMPLHKRLVTQGADYVNSRDIPALIDRVYQISYLPKGALHPLGSVGKTEWSGDVDLGVDNRLYDADVIHLNMVDALGEENCHFTPGVNIGSYCVPVPSPESIDLPKGFAQVDLMYVDDIEWAKFAYSSPGDSSKYKGAIRGILLAAVAAQVNEHNQDVFLYLDDGRLYVRVGWAIDPNKGMKRVFQMRGKHKKTGAWLKTLKKVTPEEIQKEYPYLTFCHDQITITNPTEVVEKLFGKGVKPEDVESAEQVIEAIRSTYSQWLARQIFEIASVRMKPLKDKMKIPEECYDVY